MKKNRLMALMAIVVLMLQADVLPAKPEPAFLPKHFSQAQHALVDYTWYTDPDLTDPTGTISNITTELNRLRNLYSGFTFSSSPGAGLAPFEYGYCQFNPIAIIYSNF